MWYNSTGNWTIVFHTDNGKNYRCVSIGLPSGKIRSLKECVFVNSALKIQCTLIQTAFSATLPISTYWYGVCWLGSNQIFLYSLGISLFVDFKISAFGCSCSPSCLMAKPTRTPMWTAWLFLFRNYKKRSD